jgi:large subunit ribosomal protein L3
MSLYVRVNCPVCGERMAMLLGRKIGMTSLYDESGQLVPVTVIKAGPCTIMQVKTTEIDGYNAIQLGYDDVKPSCQKKPEIGHAQKAGVVPKKFVKEMRLPDGVELQYKIGDTVTVSAFSESGFVDVIGASKGKGFAGVMKRHGFTGFPATHGTERKHRAPGSISSYSSDAGHGGSPKKGTRMAGHMGGRRVTVKNHKLISIDTENHLLVVKGGVPGPNGSYCVVRSVDRD